MAEGWIKLHRKSTENELYFADPFTRWQAWQDLILIANHKKRCLVKRGVIVSVERGQVGLSVRSLAKRWKWSTGKTQRFLKWLKTEAQIDTVGKGVSSCLQIVNYEKYQSDGYDDGCATDAQPMRNRCADGYKNKNEKKVKNVKEGGAPPHFVPPTLEQIQAYAGELGIQINASRFISYYQAGGWMLAGNRPMVDWRAAVEIWHERGDRETEDAEVVYKELKPRGQA